MTLPIEVGRFALRTFSLHKRSGGKLEIGAVAQVGDFWKNGVCIAECLKGLQNHEAPHADCSCGIYATLDLANLMRQYSLDATNLTAVIAAEGKTIIGPVGLRTERARVVAYRTPHPWEDLTTALPDAEYYANISQMLTAYGLPEGDLLPQDLLSLDIPPTKQHLERWVGPVSYSVTSLSSASILTSSAPSPWQWATGGPVGGGGGSYARTATTWSTGAVSGGLIPPMI